ncbi:MAG: DinB family protein [Dehalococcoidia bacterium]
METIWRTSLGRAYERAIDSLAKPLRDCPDQLWDAGLWEVRKDQPFVWPVRTVDGAYGDTADQERLLQVCSAFWNVAYHALFHLDFYLSGAVLPFAPPAPFREDEHHANVVPNRPYTRTELQDYLAYDRQKARATFATLTDEQAASPLPPDSQHAGRPFADLLLLNLLHVQEHAAHLGLFLGQRAGLPTTG